jgi:hypothetical protein
VSEREREEEEEEEEKLILSFCLIFSNDGNRGMKGGARWRRSWVCLLFVALRLIARLVTPE